MVHRRRAARAALIASPVTSPPGPSIRSTTSPLSIRSNASPIARSSDDIGLDRPSVRPGSAITTTQPVTGRRPLPMKTTSFQLAEISIARRPQLEHRSFFFFGMSTKKVSSGSRSASNVSFETCPQGAAQCTEKVDMPWRRESPMVGRLSPRRSFMLPMARLTFAECSSCGSWRESSRAAGCMRRGIAPSPSTSCVQSKERIPLRKAARAAFNCAPAFGDHAMATDTWIGPNRDTTGANPGSGDFATAADWSTGSEPGTDDTAVLADAASADAYTVTSSSSVQVESLTVGVNATLAVGGGGFTVLGMSATNNGTISITAMNNVLRFERSTFLNSGTVSNESGAQSTLDLLLDHATNQEGGIISATTGSFEIITDQGSSFTNMGVVQALGGNELEFSERGPSNLSNGGTLTGGTWKAVGNGSTIAFDGGMVTTLAATIVLDGAGSVFQANGTSLDDSLTTIDAGGILRLLDDRGYDTTNAITDDGRIRLDGDTFTAASLTEDATGGSFTGTGTVDATVSGALDSPSSPARSTSPPATTTSPAASVAPPPPPPRSPPAATRSVPTPSSTSPTSISTAPTSRWARTSATTAT